MRRLRLVVLASGRGSNLESLIRASREGRMAADVVLVVVNRPEAGAIEKARKADVPVEVVPSKGKERETHDRELIARIDAAEPDLVALAGYMRILSPHFIRHYEGRLINIHPSLLPSFPGLDAQSQAHEAGVRIAGCTTHFVTEDVDAGPVVMQAAVAVPPGADRDALAARILEAEHRIYPATVHLIATGKARWEDGRVVYQDVPDAASSALVSPEVEP